MFIDKIKVQVTGGGGGRGCMSFLREKFVAYGGPNGGDGGRGGRVTFEATENEQNLNALRYKSHFEAKRGQHGMGKQCHGKAGDDVLVMVPIGTIVRDVEDDMKVVIDLDEDGATFIAAKGGEGGKGNMCFATSTNRAPRKTSDPTDGEYREYELELKIIADIGLVGYPNAGFHVAIPFPPGKRLKHRRLRANVPRYFDWEYNGATEMIYNRYYERRPNENRSEHYFNPDYIKNELLKNKHYK